MTRSLCGASAVLSLIVALIHGQPAIYRTPVVLPSGDLEAVTGGSTYCYISGTLSCNANFVGCANAGGTGPNDYCPYINGVATCTYETGYQAVNGNYAYAKISASQNGSLSTANQPDIVCYNIDNCNYNQPCQQDPMRNNQYYCVDMGPTGNTISKTPRVPAGGGCMIGS